MENLNNVFSVKELTEYKNKINEAIDNRIEYLNRLKTAEGFSNKSFGFIKESFEMISPELFKTKKGKEIINSYISLIKENRNLYILHSIYESFRKIDKNSIDFFADSLLENDEKITSDYDKDVKRLSRVLSEGFLMTKVKESSLPIEKEETNTALLYLASNSKNLNNISEINEAIRTLKTNEDNVKTSMDEEIKKFNEKYSKQLTEEELELITKENRKEIFEYYKNKCSLKLDECIRIEKKENKLALMEIKDKITKKEFDNDSFINDIANIMDIITTINENEENNNI